MAIGPLLMADGANRGIDRSQNYLGPSAQPKSTIGPADVIRTSEFAALSVHDRTTYARQLCDMVLALHGAGIVLVDFKPSNVMIKYSLAARVPTLKAIDADSWRLAGSPLGSITGGGSWSAPPREPIPK